MVGGAKFSFGFTKVTVLPPARVSPNNLTGDDGRVLRNGEYAGDRAAWHVFDGDDGTTWFAHTDVSFCFVGYHFVSAQNVIQYKFRGGGIWHSQAWRLEYSDDGSTWYTADTQTSQNVGATWWDSGTISSSGSHAYWRIYWTGSDNMLNLEISSVEFWA